MGPNKKLRNFHDQNSSAPCELSSIEILTDKHVANISLGESCRKHSGIDTGEENRCRLRIVSNFFELLHHVAFECVAIF